MPDILAPVGDSTSLQYSWPGLSMRRQMIVWITGRREGEREERTGSY